MPKSLFRLWWCIVVRLFQVVNERDEQGHKLGCMRTRLKENQSYGRWRLVAKWHGQVSKSSSLEINSLKARHSVIDQFHWTAARDDAFFPLELYEKYCHLATSVNNQKFETWGSWNGSFSSDRWSRTLSEKCKSQTKSNLVEKLRILIIFMDYRKDTHFLTKFVAYKTILYSKNGVVWERIVRRHAGSA